MAEDSLTLGTSQNTREKRQTRYRERAREKAANIVIRNSASDKPIPKTMPLCFFSKPPTTLGMEWLDRPIPQKSNINTWTQKGEWNTDIKGDGNKASGGAGVLELWLKDGLVSPAKPARALFPVGTTTKPITRAQGHTFQAHSQ